MEGDNYLESADRADALPTGITWRGRRWTGRMASDPGPVRGDYLEAAETEIAERETIRRLTGRPRGDT